MSAESIFLINPRGRKRRRKGRMPAGLARYWASRRGGKKRRKARAVMTNPRRRRRRARLSNPRRRRRSVAVYSHKRRRRHNPIFRRRARHRRRNPFSMGGLKGMLVPAAIGAGGAIALAVAYAYVAPKLPATFTTGYFATAVKLAGAIGLGMFAGKFLGRSQGHAVTLGGLTVVLVSAIQPLVAQAMPTVPGLSGGVGAWDYIPYSRGMGAYMKRGGLGYYSPAAVIGAGGPGTQRQQMAGYMTRPVAGMAGLGDMSGGSGYTGMSDGM